MTLKLIPLEPGAENNRSKKQKHFNPGNRIKRPGKEHSLKAICLKLVHFINRGSRFTAQQIDELIESLHRSILNLQKKKQELMKRRK